MLILDIHSVLRRNYQRMSTNRFVVDSPRFWRREFNPRFKDIFTPDEFKDVLVAVNGQLSFPVDDVTRDTMAEYMYKYFAGYRFVDIPTKNPEAPSQFLSDMYFALMDILGQISFKDYPLEDDDFNLVTHRAETGKEDRTRLGTAEHNTSGSRASTEADILSSSTLSTTDEASVENIDEEGEQNTKQATDVFLSPQNQGVTPTNDNIKHEGVDGVTLHGNAAFTTNTQNAVVGDSTKNKSNTTSADRTAVSSLEQDNDIKNVNEATTDFGMTQEQENATTKNDNYVEALDFNRGGRLQDWYNLSKDRLWRELFGRLARWILQVDIATADRNYNDCPMYK